VVDGGLSPASSAGGLPPEVTQIFEKALPSGLGKRIVPA
jgi:hypothetical protein